MFLVGAVLDLKVVFSFSICDCCGLQNMLYTNLRFRNFPGLLLPISFVHPLIVISGLVHVFRIVNLLGPPI